MKTFGLSFFLLFLAFADVRANFEISEHDARLLVNSTVNFTLSNSQDRTEDKTLYFHYDDTSVVVEPTSIRARRNETKWTITIRALKAGSSVINATANKSYHDSDVGPEFSETIVRVTVQKSQFWYVVSQIVGWIYFAAWSVSFYPQIWTNYNRKSVIGLNFDFVSLNIVGFALYSLYNCGLYWIPAVEEQYFKDHPGGANPVEINDIFFGLHAMLATAVTIAQCFMYETGSQRISTTVKFIHSAFVLLVLTFGVLACLTFITWLQFLVYCSSIKLVISLIKYVPQAWFNYTRQSTVGWSIGNILLDFTGGILSMLQIFINAYNYDDWKNLSGLFIKFGLGLFSVVFDVFFMVQHYVLYRPTNEKSHDLKGRV